MVLFKKVPSINFMRFRFFAFVFSLLVVCGGLAGLASDKMTFGIDFTGGALLEVDLNESASSKDVRTVLSNFEGMKVQEFGQDRHFLIRLPYPEGENALKATGTLKRKVLTALKSKWKEAKYRRIESVGPKMSGELITTGLYALTLAILAMLIYIWVRFQWRFSLGAVVALTHDVLFAVAFFVVTGMEFDLSSLAALLTIIGYSINDTVVIFDRLREVIARGKSKSLFDLINRALNETLSRTLITSLTTVLALVVILLLGGPVLFPFVLLMLIGILIGTYSSMFIAAPVLFYLSKFK